MPHMHFWLFFSSKLISNKGLYIVLIDLYLSVKKLHQISLTCFFLSPWLFE